MGECELDLAREAARDVRVLEGFVIDRVGEEAEEPVKNRTIGTKKRNSRNAIALPTSVPAESRVAVPHADAYVDERPVLVLVVGLLCLDPALRVPPHAPLAGKRET